jgi:hypothetical protein
MPIRCITAALVQEIIRSYGQVRKLNLSSNAIERVEDLEALTSLTKLNIAANQLTSSPGCLEGLLRLTALEELDLSCNEIRQLEVFSHHVIQQQQQQQAAASLALHSLNLADNHISDMAQIVHLQQLRSLTKLQLTGNPVCNVMHYRAKVKALLPQLLELDDEPLTDDRGYSSSSDHSNSNHSCSSSSTDCSDGDIVNDVADSSNHAADSVLVDRQVSVAGTTGRTVPAIAETASLTAMPTTAVATHTQSTAAAAMHDGCTDDVLAGLAILSPVAAADTSVESTVTAALPTVAAAQTEAVIVADTAVTEQSGSIAVTSANTLQQQQQEQQQPQQQQYVTYGIDVNVDAIDAVLAETEHSRTGAVAAATVDDNDKTNAVNTNDNDDDQTAATTYTTAAADNSVAVANDIANDDGNSQSNSQTASSESIVNIAIPHTVDDVHAPNTVSDTASVIAAPVTTAAHDVDMVAEQQQHSTDTPAAVVMTATGSTSNCSDVTTVQEPNTVFSDACSSNDTTNLQCNADDRLAVLQSSQSSNEVASIRPTIQLEQQQVITQHNAVQQRLPQLYDATAVASTVQQSTSNSNLCDNKNNDCAAQQPTSVATAPVVHGAVQTIGNSNSNDDSGDADVIASLQREVALLTVQNAAMKRAALMADTAITASSSHVNATKQQQQQQQRTVSRVRRRPWETTDNSNNTSSHDDVKVDSTEGYNAAASTDSHGDGEQRHDGDVSSDDKYVKLLNHWRHEVVKLLIQQASQEVCQLHLFTVSAYSILLI